MAAHIKGVHRVSHFGRIDGDLYPECGCTADGEQAAKQPRSAHFNVNPRPTGEVRAAAVFLVYSCIG